MGGKPHKGTPADRRLKANKHLPPKQQQQQKPANKPAMPAKVK